MMGMKFFYQSHAFYAGQFTKTIFPQFEHFNKYIALWFIAWFNKYSPILLGGLVRDFENIFNNIEISVPFINNEIAFTHIEARVRELEEQRVRELEAYLSEAGFDDCKLTEYESKALSDYTYKEFSEHPIYDGVFKVTNSHNILKSDIVLGSGTTPYVTAGEGDNSIMGYISYNNDMIEPGNSILIGGKTMVVTYQPDDFFSNDSHNLLLSLKSKENGNENVYLFLAAALKKSLGHKYHWGDSISKQKIKSDIVNLPMNGNEVDYPFMDTIISGIKKRIIANLKSFIDKEHQAYLEVTK